MKKFAVKEWAELISDPIMLRGQDQRNGQEIDLKNDVWTVIGACGTSESAGSPVYFNTIVGFKHRATGGNLHSHGMDCGTTPKSNHQQGTLS
ncbi:10169_t:CDS:2 [Entrophospora sp. SA101]|nr:10169_t:CDS:2 [Entrophospora sp. SA101]